MVAANPYNPMGRVARGNPTPSTASGVTNLYNTMSAAKAAAKAQSGADDPYSMFPSSIREIMRSYDTASRSASAQQLGLLEGAGTQARSDITRQATEDLGTLQSSLAARGLSNSSVYDSLAARTREAEQRNLAGVDENVATQKAGYVYQPNPNLYGEAEAIASQPRQKHSFLGTALPIAGAVIGSFIAPGVGTAVGGALGGIAGAAIDQGSVSQGGAYGYGLGSTFAPLASQVAGGSGYGNGAFGGPYGGGVSGSGAAGGVPATSMFPWYGASGQQSNAYGGGLNMTPAGFGGNFYGYDPNGQNPYQLPPQRSTLELTQPGGFSF
jgi:hypothetical protein